MLVFILNVILNIKMHYLQYCKCDGINICKPCEIADIFKEEISYKLYNCFDLDFLSKVRENLHLHLNNLLENHDHFLCRIINERYCYNWKCFFTGKKSILDVHSAVLEWENIKIENIKNNNA